MLKQAQTTYLERHQKHHKKADYKNAVTELESAQNLYRQAGNNVEPKLLDFIIGYCQKPQISKIEESNEKLSPFHNHCQNENYKWLGLQTNIWLATNDFSLKKFSAGLAKLEVGTKTAKERIDIRQINKKYFRFLQKHIFQSGNLKMRSIRSRKVFVKLNYPMQVREKNGGH